MSADFLKLVGTEQGRDLVDQIDQMGVNLTQQNLAFINQYTGVVDILHGHYHDELSAGEVNKNQGTTTGSGQTTAELEIQMTSRAEQQRDTIQNYLYLEQVSGETQAVSDDLRTSGRRFLNGLDQIVELSNNIHNGTVAFDEKAVSEQMAHLQASFGETLGIAGSNLQDQYIAAINRRLDQLPSSGREYINKFLHLDELMNLKATPTNYLSPEEQAGGYVEFKRDVGDPVSLRVGDSSDINGADRDTMNLALSNIKARLEKARNGESKEDVNSLMSEYFRINHALSLK